MALHDAENKGIPLGREKYKTNTRLDNSRSESKPLEMDRLVMILS